MADRPILFSAPMIRALLDGRKTQTRRITKVPGIMGGRYPVYPPEELIELEPGEFRAGIMHYASTGALSGPYNVGFAVGDRLWVKETWRTLQKWDDLKPKLIMDDIDEIDYFADGYPRNPLWAWGKNRVSIFMPRWASRLTLTVTDVRVERLQDCSEADALAEGIEQHGRFFGLADGDWDDAETSAVAAYERLWESINGAGAWEANPWVVAISFGVEHRNIDQ